MVLESTMICVDNSEYMRNGDFLPTRLLAQQAAVHLICYSKIRSNPENDIGLLILANKVEVLATLTNNVGHILTKLHNVQPTGEMDFATGIRIAHLTLKHRQGKHHKMRILIFVGSPVTSETEELVKLAKKLRKEKVCVDIVSFGEDSINSEILILFINTLNGQDGSSNHLVTVSIGSDLSDTVMSSPILQDEERIERTGLGGSRFEFGVDTDEDPELALALRISLEEERRRQELEAERMQGQSIGIRESVRDATDKTPLGRESEEEYSTIVYEEPINFADMTEEEQLAFVTQMSIQDESAGSSNSSSRKEDSVKTNAASRRKKKGDDKSDNNKKK